MRHDRARLVDILDAAERIAERVARGRKAFDANEDMQLATIRLIEIVGEACAKLSRDLRDNHPHAAWAAAAAMRNRVIHGYFDIDLNIVWAAAEREIPLLAQHVQEILSEFSE